MMSAESNSEKSVSYQKKDGCGCARPSLILLLVWQWQSLKGSWHASYYLLIWIASHKIRSLSLSYQKEAKPSFGVTLTIALTSVIVTDALTTRPRCPQLVSYQRSLSWTGDSLTFFRHNNDKDVKTCFSLLQLILSICKEEKVLLP